VRTNYLQSNDALDFPVAGLVHGAHAAHAKQFLDLVAATEDFSLMEDRSANGGEDGVRRTAGSGTPGLGHRHGVGRIAFRDGWCIRTWGGSIGGVNPGSVIASGLSAGFGAAAELSPLDT